jgi:Rrf2 family iron-sulfur cluster assembly transcriptional regulator
VLYIAGQSLQQVRSKLSDVVQHIGSPEAFTGKVLGTLSRHNIIDSYTGPHGGFEISQERLHVITIADIVRAFEGDEFFDDCVLGLGMCDAKHPCPMHHSVDPVRKRLMKVLQQTSVYELAMGLNNEVSLLIR